ncbi:non-canonical purine NTP pyrophosphatase [Candidatus Peregrinibacteria bacterium]|nr:non-canonical purine NTP pyrophosphatase [Candidatus Peregrinibacteria bacterium]
MKILIATRNRGKFNGLMEGLEGLPFQFVSLEDEGIEGDVVETGENYEENAILKAEHFGRKSGLITLSDDSGIVVDALANELGVKTRRWGAGHEASDQEWLDFFLKRLAQEQSRKAEFICVVALYRPNKNTLTFRGETKGVIMEKPETEIEHGIPLSSVFLPEGQTKVFSAMRKEEFVQASHRGKAVRQCRDFLNQMR